MMKVFRKLPTSDSSNCLERSVRRVFLFSCFLMGVIGSGCMALSISHPWTNRANQFSPSHFANSPNSANPAHAPTPEIGFAPGALPGRNVARHPQSVESIANTSVSLAAIEEVCSPTRPGRTIRNVIAMFEGRDGYSAPVAREWRRLLSLDPVCKQITNPPGSATLYRDVVYFSNGARMDVSGFVAALFDLVPKGKSGAPTGMRGLIQVGACWDAGLSMLDTEVLYFPSTQPIQEASNCIEKWAKEPFKLDDGSVRYPSLAIAGFSNGGAQAIMTAHELRNRNIHIDFGLTIDPVPRDWDTQLPNILFQATGKGLESPFASPDGVKWENYYQTIDNRFQLSASEPDGSYSILYNRGLHGASVQNASPNDRVVPPVDMKARPNGAHYKIFDHPLVQMSIASKFRKLPQYWANKKTWWAH